MVQALQQDRGRIGIAPAAVVPVVNGQCPVAEVAAATGCLHVVTWDRGLTLLIVRWIKPKKDKFPDAQHTPRPPN